MSNKTDLTNKLRDIDEGLSSRRRYLREAEDYASKFKSGAELADSIGRPSAELWSKYREAQKLAADTREVISQGEAVRERIDAELQKLG